MNDKTKEAFNTIMYWLTKKAARDSFVDFLEETGVTEDEWSEIKTHLSEHYGVKTYV